jgi:hypothetical protein
MRTVVYFDSDLRNSMLGLDMSSFISNEKMRLNLVSLSDEDK